MSRKSAFTLVELMITVALVSVMGLAIIASVIFGIYAKQLRQERNGAMRVLGDLLESRRKTLFETMAREDLSDVVIDDRGTATTSDDITATVTVRYYLTDGSGTEVGTPDTPIPLDRSMIRATVTANWRTAGYQGARPQTLTLSTLVAPP